MRNTLSAWRSTSTAPMNTRQSSPNSAAAVAVATPCWPAPVSAITRCLPMRRVSSAWPSTLLILCDPVWVRSSRFSRTRTPSRSDSRWHSVTGVGRPAYEREQLGELAPELVGDPRGAELGLELHRARGRASRGRSDRRTRRSGRARPVRGPAGRGARAPPGRVRSSGHRYGSRAVGHPVVRRAPRGRAPIRRSRPAASPAARASSMNRRSLRASLRPEPGVVSTPVDTSTPHGRTRRIACATFSPLSPPARRRRTPGGHRRRPAPSRRRCRSRVRWRRRARCRPGRCRPRRARGRRPRSAWITNGTRLRIQRTSDSGSRPWSCAPPSPSVLTSSTTRSLVSSRNTPTVITPRGRRWRISPTVSGVDLARAARSEHETRARRRRGRRRAARPPRW